MKTAKEYHSQYPIGSQWLLPVTVCAHAVPEYDDWDPHPIQIKPTTGGTTIEHCVHAHAANDAPESVTRTIRDLYNILIERIQKTSNLKH